jgi:hypothetical protein
MYLVCNSPAAHVAVTNPRLADEPPRMTYMYLLLFNVYLTTARRLLNGYRSIGRLKRAKTLHISLYAQDMLPVKAS